MPTGIGLVGRIALPIPVFAGLHLEIEVLELVLPLEIHVLQHVGDPAQPRFADHDLEVGITFERAAEDQRHQHVAHVHLEAGDVRGLHAAHDILRHLRVVGRAPADGVEVHGDAGLVRALPQRLPERIPQRRHVRPVGDVEAAHAALGVAHHLGHRLFHVVVGNVGQPDQPVGRGTAEVVEPVVVDAQHLQRRLGIVQPAARAQHAVQDLGLHAVAVLVLQPELGLGEAADALLAVVVEAGRGHAVGAMDDARHVFAAGRAHAVHQAELGALGADPLGSLRPLDDVGHAVLEGRRGVAGEKVGRQPDQVDMAVSGDDVVFHGRVPPGGSSSRRTRRAKSPRFA